MTVVTGPPGRTPPRPVPDLDELRAGRGAADHTAGGTATVTRPAPVVPQRFGPPDVGSVPRRLGDVGRTVALLALVVGASVGIGLVTGGQGRTLLHDRMLPWILGRTFGVGSYVALSAVVVLGLWLRHPWRAQVAVPSAPAILWAHVTLAAGTVMLLAGHLTALALDRYAGVGWVGAFVPWGAHYRPTATALGTMALYALVLVAGTAALAGSIARRVWFPVHTVSVLVFCLTLAHGILAGSDAYALRWVYVASGGLVLVLQATRWIGGRAGHGPAAVPE
jgi:hypothetical protein